MKSRADDLYLPDEYNHFWLELDFELIQLELIQLQLAKFKLVGYGLIRKQRCRLCSDRDSDSTR